MRLSVHHATRFEFDQPSGHSIHDVRLTPKPASGQRLISWRIDGPGKRSEWLDGHGNQVTTFSVAHQHDHVEIVLADQRAESWPAHVGPGGGQRMEIDDRFLHARLHAICASEPADSLRP